MAKVTGQQSATVPPGESMLNTNALGLWGLVIMGIAYMGLALTAYFNFGLMEGITGPIVPLAFAAVTVAMLPTAASYAIMNSRRPSTGATLTWLWEATTPPLGVWLGWVLVIAYIVGWILQPVMFGLFFNSFLNFFGVHAGYLSATLAGLIPILVVGYMTKKDIRISARIVGLFIMIEAGFVALLCLYIMIKQAIDGNLSWSRSTLRPRPPGGPASRTHCCSPCSRSPPSTSSRRWPRRRGRRARSCRRRPSTSRSAPACTGSSRRSALSTRCRPTPWRPTSTPASSPRSTWSPTTTSACCGSWCR